MKITSTRLVYIQPVLFKTISFHHQSQYFIEFELKYGQTKGNHISAFPSMVKYSGQTGFNKKLIFRPQNKNKAQTQKFLILFNDQTVVLKGGCNFVVQTDRNAVGGKEGARGVETYLVMSLMKQHCEKDANSQIVTNSSGKIQKVGEQIMFINLNVLQDYSEHSSYRHIMFKKDEYFCSLLFYIDVVHLGMGMKLNDGVRIDELEEMETKKSNETINQVKNQLKQKSTLSSLRTLLPFKDLKKLYKLLITDRLQEFKRVVAIYYAAIDIRLKYINNYEIEEPQNIESIDFNKRDSIQVLFDKQQNYSKDLNYLEERQFFDNADFFEHYETDSIDDVYMAMFHESKLINLNVRKMWQRMNMLKLKTLPEEFMTYALKFKIDRMTYITSFYATIDELMYSDPNQMNERVKNHKIQRNNICETSRFYNINELKHSMLTFHSIKAESIISNTSEKNQSQILVVLVHGYQGSQRDMAKIKSFINTFTSINFLSLETLSKEANQDIATLGKKGAEQISKYLQKKTYIQSISVIGFSLGGIIAKAILTNLQAHKGKFNLFMTLSSPHLGISELENCLVATGIMWMKKVNRSKNIKELCCQPLERKQGNITLLNLSQQAVLSWFNHVVLIGSNEDTYVPKYSSLLAYQGSNKIIEQIQKNTLKHIKSMDRITVWFQYQENCFERLVGRKGHISFIEDDTFIQYIIAKYLHFF